MMTTDPVADMLTRIRNGITAGKSEVIMPHSKLKAAIAGILHANGYLGKVSVLEQGGFKQLSLQLNGSTSPESLVRVSKPGRRIYAKASDIPTVRTGRGIVIISTPAGIMTGKEARTKGIGGELICKVY
ncbi:30S ribosomal protein S8 [Candidatus Saccharibacteria bacterium]|nr:30S ribosomal protein S8 [Candidatus Saccharibacteria bacterium]